MRLSLKKNSNPKYYIAARNKFKLWLFTEDQIDAIEQHGEVQFTFDIVSHGNGTVVQKHISMGDHIMEGMSMFKIIDLSKVWVELDAYESDIPWINKGAKVDISFKSLPGKLFTSEVAFINPVLNDISNTTTVRVELNNNFGKLRPGMFAKASIQAMLDNKTEALLIPKSAVLWTGKNSVVYVKEKKGESFVFYYREVLLGEDTGTHYVVNEGLLVGESIVTNGAFKIDAATQLKGSKSMMNPEEGSKHLGGHADMEM